MIMMFLCVSCGCGEVGGRERRERGREREREEEREGERGKEEMYNVM